MASGIYNYFKAFIMAGIYNLANGGHAIKCALMNDSHSFTASNNGWSNVSANEVSGDGYPNTNSNVLQNQSVAIVSNIGVFDADNISWSDASFTVYHAVLYNDTPTTPQADPLICSIDFGGAQTVNAGTFTIQWSDDGIINIS